MGATQPSSPATVAIDVESVALERSNTDVMVPVRERGNLSTIARSPKKRRLHAASAPATAGGKKENALDATEAAKLSHLFH